MGQIAGTVAGIAGSFLIGNAAGGTMGLVRCGSGLQKAARLYSALDTGTGIASATINIANGNAGPADVLGLAPALGFAAGKLAGLPTNCFEAGTVVLTGGSAGDPGVFEAKNIEDIQVGDLVWTKDESDPNGEMVLRPVTEVFVSTAYDLQELSIQGADGNVEVIHVTDEHPFYVQGRGWTGASSLREGFEVVTADGARYTVIANTDDVRSAGVTVYNLEVADGHTYFVADGSGADTFVWAHNACAKVLGADLPRNGILKTGADAIPHHIVPRGSYRGNADVARAKAILERWGIGLDEAANGVWLPSSRLRKVVGAHARGIIHEPIHTNAYFEKVFERLRAANRSRADVENALTQIAFDLLSGRF